MEQRVGAYQKACDKLRSHAVETGHVAYRQVLEAVYGNDALLSQYLESTIKWQKTHQARYTFFSNYVSTDSPIPLTEIAPTRNPKLGSTLIGRYDPRKHTIAVATIANGHAVAHESGHALQQRALLNRRSWRAQSEQFDPLLTLWRRLASGRDPKSLSTQRLRYLSSQDELEIRLQDLNRLHAIAIGKGPIQTPEQALFALAYIKVPLSEAAVHSALEGSAWEMSADELGTLLRQASAAPALPTLETLFEDAYELRRLYRLIQRLEPELWDATLNKILFEAPGQL